MKKYELALVIAPTLDEEALAAEKASVNALIERFGGTVDKVDDWGKRRLAYEINKVNEVSTASSASLQILLLQLKSNLVCVSRKTCFVT